MTNVACITAGTGWKPAGAFVAFGLAAAMAAQGGSKAVTEMDFVRVTAGNASTNDGHFSIRSGAASQAEKRDFVSSVSKVFSVMMASQVEVDPEILDVVSRGFWELFEG